MIYNNKANPIKEIFPKATWSKFKVENFSLGLALVTYLISNLFAHYFFLSLNFICLLVCKKIELFFKFIESNYIKRGTDSIKKCSILKERMKVNSFPKNSFDRVLIIQIFGGTALPNHQLFLHSTFEAML